jgi:hypothetical protein
VRAQQLFLGFVAVLLGEAAASLPRPNIVV